ncbi:MAG: hypothetical protein HBSAPP04_23750 [Ignavibacteriaceae bacterium]|nr:MAG: DUF2442 domain-containing protein [Chlorobiota bacterium]GJQ33536.1 MAG: hypothetical protein HBSAPP04_23750 [Ignavibacteriaceae bacterium]
MKYEVISANYLQDYKIELRFRDGTTGIVDFQVFLGKGRLTQPLLNKDFFRCFKVNADLGTLVWENGYDIAPDTLYYLVTGKHEYLAGLPQFIKDAFRV